MKIELRNITYNARLSEETAAYAAVVWIDGERAFDVKNDGHGGCDYVYAIGAHDERVVNDRIAEEFPPMDMSRFGMDPMPATLESVCNGLLDDYIILRDVKRRMGKSVLFIDDGQEWQMKFTRGGMAHKPTPANIAEVREKYPNALILNGQTDSLILERVKALAS